MPSPVVLFQAYFKGVLGPIRVCFCRKRPLISFDRADGPIALATEKNSQKYKQLNLVWVAARLFC